MGNFYQILNFYFSVGFLPFFFFLSIKKEQDLGGATKFVILSCQLLLVGLLRVVKKTPTPLISFHKYFIFFYSQTITIICVMLFTQKKKVSCFMFFYVFKFSFFSFLVWLRKNSIKFPISTKLKKVHPFPMENHKCYTNWN